MISIKLKFRPSNVESKEGGLYCRVICDRMTRQINVPYRIFREEWDPDAEDIVIAQGSSRTAYLESVKRELANYRMRFAAVLQEMLKSEVRFTADTVVARFQEQSSCVTLFDYMEQQAARYWRQGQCRTSETYSATLSSFKKFRAGVDVRLKDIDSDLLEAYESHLKGRGLALNTISFYMKHLRAIYNHAADNGIMPDRKPFKRVTTSIEKTAKRAISLKTIKKVKAMDCCSKSRQFAKDMFLFSFYTRGMSFVDIAFLQKKNLRGNTLIYKRKKTGQQLAVRWEPCMQKILENYSADASSPYLFSIIRAPEHEPRKQYHSALFLINRHLKAMGEALGLNQPLTMYCARHSWASIARDEGIPLSVISEGLGHDSEKTTRIYLASLKTEVVDDANRKILKLL